MKELSIGEKAKRYDEAIEKAKQYHEECKMRGNDWFVEDIEEMFPELKENEDERIRKNCIHFLELQKKHHAATFEIEECIAWLEKQGEREQKPTDKVELKFGVGDWITFYEGEPFKILKVELEQNGILDYLLLRQNGHDSYYNKKYVDENARLWTIQDAKDGDVLVASDGSIFLFAGVVDCACKYYVALTIDNYVKINREVEGGYWETSRAVHPATKEQHDKLEKAIKGAGYKWDAKKKELERIGKDI